MLGFKLSSYRNALATYLLLCSLVVLLPAGVSLRAETSSQSTDTASRIQAEIENSFFKHSHWGIEFVDFNTGKIIYKFDNKKLFGPASLSKLFVAAYSADSLGLDFRFKTEVHAVGKISDDGTLEGNLVLTASGDPDMGGRLAGEDILSFTSYDHSYANLTKKAELLPTNPLFGIESLATKVSANGIKKIAGRVIVDNSLFAKAVGPGNFQQSIIISDNLIDFIMTPTASSTESENRVRLSTRPDSPIITVENKLTTTSTPSRLKIDKVKKHQQPSYNYSVSGTVSNQSAETVRTRPLENPKRFTEMALSNALRKTGISIGGKNIAQGPKHLQPSEVSNEKKLVAELVSPPLEQYLKVMLKTSHNNYARVFSILPQVEYLRDKTRAQQLKPTLGRFLSRAKVEHWGMYLAKNAGIEQLKLLTPHSINQLLLFLFRDQKLKLLLQYLPVLGRDGTLRDYASMETKLTGNLRAKTGTVIMHNFLNGGINLESAGLAGVFTSKSGQEVVFTAVVNDVPLHNIEELELVRNAIIKICEIVYQNH